MRSGEHWLRLTDNAAQIWDLRTGAISDTIRYEYPVTSLQFDSRKIVAATGENQVKVGAGRGAKMGTDYGEC